MASGGFAGFAKILEGFSKNLEKPTSLGEGLKALQLNTTKGMAQSANVFGNEGMRGLKAATPLVGLKEALTDKHGGFTGIADKTVGSSATGALSGIGGALGDVGGGLMKTGNPYAMAAGAALKLGGALLGIPDKIKKWGDSLHEANRAFSQFSGSMAAVMAADDAKRIGLQREQGERRAGSAGELANARFRLDKAMSPIEDAFANLKNKVVGKLTDVLGGLAEHIAKLFPGGSGKDITFQPTIRGYAGMVDADIDRIEKEIRASRPERLRD